MIKYLKEIFRLLKSNFCECSLPKIKNMHFLGLQKCEKCSLAISQRDFR